MRNVWLSNLALVIVLTFVVPQAASPSGTILELPADACPPITLKSVTLAPVTYTFTGVCNLAHTRAALDISVPFTVIGTYDPMSGKTTEDINLPPPAINQPNRPYGRFLASMHCPADPWRNPPDTVRCDQVVASVNPPASAWPPNDFGNYARDLISQILPGIQESRRPYSTGYDQKALDAQYQAAVNAPALEAKRKAEQAALEAQRRSQQAVKGKESSGIYLALIYPSVVMPKGGQSAVAQSPLSIKLTPPKGWTVGTYTVNIQRRDPNGPWVNHTSIQVNAAVAESAAGYVGFGNGAPPAYLMLPGHWRLNAEASSPKKSGVSDWVEFTAHVLARRGRH